MNFAQLLYASRKSAGLSVREASDRAGIRHPTLLNYEAGLRVPPLTIGSRLLSVFGYQLVIRPWEVPEFRPEACHRPRGARHIYLSEGVTPGEFELVPPAFEPYP